jgi:hypothetical protein
MTVRSSRRVNPMGPRVGDRRRLGEDRRSAAPFIELECKDGPESDEGMDIPSPGMAGRGMARRGRRATPEDYGVPTPTRNP